MSRSLEAKRQKARSATARWVAKNKEHVKAYYQTNKARYAALGKRWRIENAERKREVERARHERLKCGRRAAKELARQSAGQLTRSEAKAKGLKRFTSDRECPRGHRERWTSTGGCVACGKHATKAWVGNNADKMRAMRAEYEKLNYECIKARKSADRLANPAKHKRRSAKWYEKNKESRKLTVLAWRAANREKCKAAKQNHRAKELAGGTHTAKDIASLFKTQKGKCAHSWCRVLLPKSYHVDHVMPLARGGTNDRKNLQLLCPPCNLRKNAKHPIDFAQENGLLL